MGGSTYTPEAQKPTPELNMMLASEANRGMYKGLESQAKFLDMATQVKPVEQTFAE